LALGPVALAQETAPLAEGSGLIRLSFPENTEIKVLIDYVSQRLGMNILYDEAVGKKRITIQSPAEVPKDSLLGLLKSVLKMNGLILAEADQKGWMKIVPGQDLTAVTPMAVK
jgi:type II secretory pathway component GspD/PulD (secretin)